MIVCEKCGVEISKMEQFKSSDWMSYDFCKKHFKEAKKLLAKFALEEKSE